MIEANSIYRGDCFVVPPRNDGVVPPCNDDVVPPRNDDVFPSRNDGGKEK